MKNKLKMFISVLCIAVVMAVPVMAMAKVTEVEIGYGWVDYDSERHEYSTFISTYDEDTLLDSVVVGNGIFGYHILAEDESDFEYTGNHEWDGEYHHYEFARTCYVCGRTETKDFVVKGPAGSYIEPY